MWLRNVDEVASSHSVAVLGLGVKHLAFGQTPHAFRQQPNRLQAELLKIMTQTGTLPSQYVPPSGRR